MMNVVEAKVDMRKDIEKAKELKESFFQLSEFDKIEKLEEYRKLLANEYVYFKGYEHFKHFNFREATNSNLRNEFLCAAKKEFLKIINKFRSGRFDLDSNSQKKIARVAKLLSKYDEEEIEETVGILEEIVPFYGDRTNEMIEDYLEIFMDYEMRAVFRDLNTKITEAVYPFMSISLGCKSLLNSEDLDFFSNQEIYYAGHTLTSSNFMFYAIAYLMRTKK